MIMITEIIPFYFVVDHKFTKIFTLKHLELPEVPEDLQDRQIDQHKLISSSDQNTETLVNDSRQLRLGSVSGTDKEDASQLNSLS